MVYAAPRCCARPCQISLQDAKTSAIQSKMSHFGRTRIQVAGSGCTTPVACLLCSQPGMVALKVVSTPFHIRGANAARLHPGDDFPLGKTWDDFHHSAVLCKFQGRFRGRSVLQSNVSHQRHMSFGSSCTSRAHPRAISSHNVAFCSLAGTTTMGGCRNAQAGVNVDASIPSIHIQGHAHSSSSGTLKRFNRLGRTRSTWDNMEQTALPCRVKPSPEQAVLVPRYCYTFVALDLLGASLAQPWCRSSYIKVSPEFVQRERALLVMLCRHSV